MFASCVGGSLVYPDCAHIFTLTLSSFFLKNKITSEALDSAESRCSAQEAVARHFSQVQRESSSTYCVGLWQRHIRGSAFSKGQNDQLPRIRRWSARSCARVVRGVVYDSRCTVLSICVSYSIHGKGARKVHINLVAAVCLTLKVFVNQSYCGYTLQTHCTSNTGDVRLE